MNVQDVMLGDWLNISHRKKNGIVHRIDKANGEGNGFAAVIDGDYHESLLEPIELTPEILKRSGFELEDGWWCWRKLGVSTGNLYIDVAFRDDDVSVYDVQMMGYHNASMNHHLNYVHELQHAMRIFGIDLELKITQDD